jgi:integrase
MKLTASVISRLTLPPNIDDKIFFDYDLPGFGLRLRRSGDRSWWVQYGIAGRTRKLRLGSVAELDIAKARSSAKTILAQVRLGGDPASEKSHARVRAGETVGALLKPFLLRQQTRLRPRSLKATEWHLLKLCRPLHALPIVALTRRTIAARLAEIAATNGPAASNRVRGSLGAFCSWAVKEGFRDDNPVSFTNKATENGPRDRLLSDAELALIWQALGDDQYSVILTLLILTGLRRGEIGGLRWSEIDLDSNLITLPAERTKNGRPHLVPLSSPVRALIEAQPRRNERDGRPRDRLFGDAAVEGFSYWNGAKVELDQRLAEIHGEPLAPWALHDIRRSFSTALHDRLGVPPHIVEVLLGHVGHQAGVAGTYNKSVYHSECERALSRWAEHVTAIVTGEATAAQIVRLHHKRA